MTEWVKVPDYQSPIGTECMVCGKEINLGYCTNHLVPMICEECKEAIKYAKKLMNEQVPDKVDWKKELVDDFEKHLHGNTDGILYHHYCIKCGWDWWSDEAYPNRCSKCGCELT